VYAQAMNIGGINVETAHGLQSVSNTGNVTSNTLQFSNAITGFVTTANAQIGRDLVVSGNTTVSKELTVTSNATVSSNLNVSDDLIVTNNILASNNLTVTGNATISGNVHAGGEIELYSNLNIQQVSNTATIKATSNVVTEFNRSKKLIKYPRVALNSASQDGYVVTASTDGYVSTKFHMYDPFRPFVDGTGATGANGWHTGPPDISTANNWDQTFDTSGYNKDITSYGVGGYAGTSIAGIESEWLKLELPHKIVLSHFFYQQRDGQAINYAQAPKDFRILGSNDDIDWDTIKIFTGQTSHPEGQTLTAEATKGYRYLAFVVTATYTTSTSHLTLKNLEYYGVPEYDPEAHGTDVVVKSYPNVPNTDWLERYYDAKNYSSGSTILDELTATHRDATINGSVPLDTSSGINSWSFNGNASNFISGDDNIDGIPAAGDWVHSMSIWFKTTDMSNDQNIAMILPSANLDGSTPAAASVSAFYLRGKNNGTSPRHVQIIHWSQDVRINYIFNENEWYHITYAYSGGGVSSASQHTYINGVHVPLLESTRSGSTIGDPLNISSVSRVVIGKRYYSSSPNPVNGSIANFRLFNRALSSDEIYQLYAYQKEYFGHGDLSMTLKAGRLGIGTSEPRAMLDVRGGISATGIAGFKTVFFGGRGGNNGFDALNQNTRIGGGPSPADGIPDQVNGGLALASDKRGVTLTSSDAAGVYVVFCQVAIHTGGTRSRGHWARLRKNGVDFAKSNQIIEHVTSSTYNQHILSALIDLDVGDTVTHFTDAEAAFSVYVNGTHFYMYRISTGSS